MNKNSPIEKVNADTYIVNAPIVVMADNPFENDAFEDVRQWAEINTAEESLAMVYADVSNQIGCILHDLYDKPTLLEVFKEWEKLHNELFSKILYILKSENEAKGTNHKISPNGGISAAEPFMNRNGYFYSVGWWVSKE